MEEKWLRTSDGIKIYYQVYPNEKKKKTLVLLHGLGGDVEAWKRDVAIFKQLGYSVIVVDLRGHGRSDRPTEKSDYELKRFAKDIQEIILEEHIAHAIVVGHCFGGVVAMMLEVFFPHLIQALVLVDTTYKPHFLAKSFYEHKSIQRILHLAIRIAPSLHATATRDYDKFVGTSDIDIKRLVEDIAHTSLKTYLLASELLIEMPPETFLKKITVPTLVIEGVNDTIFPLEIAIAMQKRIKHSSIEFIEDANHILVLNNPGELSATIDRFLENLK